MTSLVLSSSVSPVASPDFAEWETFCGVGSNSSTAMFMTGKG